MKRTLLFSIITLIISTITANSPRQQPLTFVLDGNLAPLPLVIWHGLGDNYKAKGLRSVGALANETNPGTYTYYVRLDPSPSSDRTATFFGNLTEQIAQVCDDLAAHPILSKALAINALGFSQGGQFLRAYVERCNKPPVANLVTFGSQHNGISEFQSCGSGDWVCQGARGLLRGNTWSNLAQSRLVPAQYFRDAEEIDPYLENSNFLADVNNERETKNMTYKENMKRLEKFVMYVFSEDTTVVPPESGWFSEVNATTGKETKLKDTMMYKEDWLGLRELDEDKRLEFRVADGGHMQLTDEVLSEAFKQYFRPKVSTGLNQVVREGRNDISPRTAPRSDNK
ncbi:Palmitoyl-protein thioesterase 1 [Varicellaria rhodocarpa]|nr:Palmitoyl-protein thioesterase 1 [Varicellaria rhodocarpa]